MSHQQSFELHSRFKQVRKETLKKKAMYPNRRHRHEKCDLKELVKKSEASYVDFREASRSGEWRLVKYIHAVNYQLCFWRPCSLGTPRVRPRKWKCFGGGLVCGGMWKRHFWKRPPCWSYVGSMLGLILGAPRVKPRWTMDHDRQ